MYQFNIRISDDMKTKVDWLSEVIGEPNVNVARRGIEMLYQAKKDEFENEQEFLDWIKTHKNP